MNYTATNMFWKKGNNEKASSVNWQRLSSVDQLETIKEESKAQPVVIFKHSTRCGISSMALNRLEREWSEDLNNIKAYYLDLISYRQISNAIENEFGIYHESPQLILIENGKAVYDASHMSISTVELKNWA